MVPGELREELTCSVCMDIYKDPVTLECGHSFCFICITKTWNSHRPYMHFCLCPECRHRHPGRPNLTRNLRLSNIAESFRSANPEQEDVRIPCAYCDSPVAAAKTCLNCEVSLCDRHLKKHNVTSGHVLLEPTASLKNRKCFIHNKALEYFCWSHMACVCVYCRLGGEHSGHYVEALNEASEKKKYNLRAFLNKLTSDIAEVDLRIQSLQETQEKLGGLKKEVTDTFKNITNELEEELMRGISRQAEKVSHKTTALGIKKEELYRKMADIEELCGTTDPLTLLQARGLEVADYRHNEEEDKEETDRNGIKLIQCLQLNKILAALDCVSPTLATTARSCLLPPDASDILLGINMVSDMSLDVGTDSNGMTRSDDLKTFFWSKEHQRNPKTPLRFCYNQVLSAESFSSGRHYWEVEGSKFGGLMVGIAYPGADSKEMDSTIEFKVKSWRLWKYQNTCFLTYDIKLIMIPYHLTCDRFGIFLDYEAGSLSCYELGNTIKHVHTFNADFNEPLHATFAPFLTLEDALKDIPENQAVWVRIR